MQVNWESVEKDVLEKIRILKIIWFLNETTEDELSTHVKLIIEDCVRLLAQFCGCVESIETDKEVKDVERDNKTKNGD